MSNFHVGQKVVCIKDGPWSSEPFEKNEVGPNAGDVLVIRGIEINSDGAWLVFKEIINPQYCYLDEYGELQFSSDDFRPVIERKTDISIFQEMLMPKRNEVPA